MIKIEALSFNHILKNVTFSISKGERVAIIGPNGAGKSTLLRVIAGVYQKSGGSLDIRDSDISYVSQRSPELMGLKVEDLIEGYHFRKGSLPNRENIQECFRFFEIESLLERRLSTLSGGELQKAFLCSSLSSAPKVLILDESLNSLDPHQYEITLSRLNQWIKKQGMTLLMVSHQLNSALSFPDRLIALKKGEIAFDIQTKDIQTKDIEDLYDYQFQWARLEYPLQVLSGAFHE